MFRNSHAEALRTRVRAIIPTLGPFTCCPSSSHHHLKKRSQPSFIASSTRNISEPMASESAFFKPTPVRSFPSSSSLASSGSVSPGESVSSTSSSSFFTTADDNGPKKSQSIVSLTTSALVGIFGTSLEDPSRAPTPEPRSNSNAPSFTTSYGDGGVGRLRSPPAKAPKGHSRKRSATQIVEVPFNSTSIFHVNPSLTALSLVARVSLLFVFGVAYGHLVTQLQDNHFVTSSTLNVSPAGSFTLTWGILGLFLGTVFPIADTLLPGVLGPKKPSSPSASMFGWSTIVRCVGIFIGVSYGIRRLPWNSTLQGAAVLAVLNPVLWYVLDTSVNGFVLSTLTAILGTSVFAWAYPSHLPHTFGWTEDYISVVIWIASIFFCSSIMFGTIGRKLLGCRN
ncbi:insulin-induced protein-domain-containing protein [Lipomyces japonicus]|uniref:insulin-induced protein-domain-containing protein n=1 Tax=Lipomyces japonicus TaxID=56871 RepID=UPI0034D006ED